MKTHLALLNDPGWLRDRYIDRRLSMRKVAVEAGVPNDNMATVRRALLRHGIPIRSSAEGRIGIPAHNKGKRASPETRRRMSQAKRGHPSPLTIEQRLALSLRMQAVKGTTDASRVKAGRREARRLYPNPEPCAKCGEMPRNMHRHHRDGDTWNNSRENIEWLCASCHRRGHTLLPPGVWNRAGLAACTGCGSSDRRHLAGGLCTRCYHYRDAKPVRTGQL